MKGKLHKMVSGYILSLNGDIDDPYAIVNKELAEGYGWYRLSFKNCQAIEQNSPNEEYVLEVNGEGWDDHLYRGSRKQTEWDVQVEMICPHPEDTYRCGIQYGCDEDGCNHPNKIPLLDTYGCLILKRI
jgi:hypothetical protein